MMENLNYHHLYLFWTLSQEGNFTKTAEKLRIAQSAVTFQIKTLEEHLGVVLIDRTNRRKPVLTEEGRAVLNYANSIFETGQELLNWVRKGDTKQTEVLRIGALSGLSRNFQFEFLKPTLQLSGVQLEVITGDQEKLVRLLKEHSLDLILSSHNVLADGRITIFSNVLTTSPIVFVINKDHKRRGAVDLRDYLKDFPLCLPGRSFEVRPEIDAWINRAKTKFRVFGEIDDIALLRIFSIKSDCVVAVPEMGVLNEIKSGDVHVIARPKGLEQKFYALTRQKVVRNSITELLIEKMRES